MNQLIYIDNIILVSKGEVQIRRFNLQVALLCIPNKMEEICRILGIRIIRDWQTRTSTMPQEQYISGIQNHFKIIPAQYDPKTIPIAGYNCIG
jgi:hypothetical protein